MSALFDFQSELMNRIATDILNPQTREAAYGFASRLDYTPVEADGCTVDITFTLTESMTKPLSAGYQVGCISTANNKMIIYELQSDATSGGTDTITSSFKQQTTYSDVKIGVVDNSADFADYPIDQYLKIIRTSISLTIDGEIWDRVDNFDNSGEMDRHFVLIYQSNGKCRIQFSDGTSGMKPQLNDVIYASFAVTEGLLGRVGAGEITINLGGDSAISNVMNSNATSGGNDSESIASIIRNARASARLRNVVFYQEDLETASRKASSSVTKAKGMPGVGTAAIYIVPAGGGDASSGLCATVHDYVKALTLFGNMPLNVYSSNYISTDISATITVRIGYDATVAQKLVEFALTLTTCENDNEVIEYHQDYGIDSCRQNVINTAWLWAFTSDENNALEAIIKQWVELLGERVYREFGQALEVGDLWIMGNSLYEYGVDVFNLTTPSSNITTSESQISSVGTLTVTVS